MSYASRVQPLLTAPYYHPLQSWASSSADAETQSWKNRFDLFPPRCRPSRSNGKDLDTPGIRLRRNDTKMLIFPVDVWRKAKVKISIKNCFGIKYLASPGIVLEGGDRLGQHYDPGA